MFQIIQRLQNVEDQVLDVKNSKFKMTKKMMDSLFSGEPDNEDSEEEEDDDDEDDYPPTRGPPQRGPPPEKVDPQAHLEEEKVPPSKREKE